MSGNLMEWYDFALYGVLAATLAELFFPHGSRLTALLSVFAVFAAGYVMRLAGGALFGHVADRVGRRRALLLSAVAMTTATVLAGLLPPYEDVGVLAPILFTALRLLQGLAVGGEFTTSIVYLVEHAPPERRALFGTLASFTAGVGMLLGSAVGNALFAVFPTERILAWAWRLPFLLALPLGLLLVLLRSALPVDEMSTSERGERRSPVRRVLREHPHEVVRCALIAWGPNAAFYALAVFLASFLATERILLEDSALTMATATMAYIVVLTPVAGYLADRVGRRAMVLVGTAACAVLAVPLFAVLRGAADSGRDLLAELVFATAVVACLPPCQVWLAERFPFEVRSSGLGVSYNLAVGILGGGTPLICTALAEWSGSPLAPGMYLVLPAVVAFVAALRTGDTRGPLP